MASSSFLYLHGGPGMNSAGERAILSDLFRERGEVLHFWDEPSHKRPQGHPFDPEHAFSELLRSVDSRIQEVAVSTGRIHLIAHSFSAIAACQLLGSHLDRLESLTLVSPVLDFKHEIKRIMALAVSDFRKPMSQKSVELDQLIRGSQSFFDESMQRGLVLAAEDSRLFDHYWKNKAVMHQFFAAWEKQGLSLDLKAFFCVLRDFAQQRDLLQGTSKFDLPVKLIFGKHDPISDLKTEIKLCENLFGRLSTFLFEESAHYPHLEESSRFLTVLKS